ncbi:hypothetical protein [Deinococcus sp.]|uniref:hypothetical protein n=1 Tax=Deinococcus sp. TaxID=47478 RepID=UPI003B5AB94D
MNLAELLSEIEALPDELAFAELNKALAANIVPPPGEEAPAAALALRLGVPELALYWAQLAGEQGAALAAAAALRLGQLETASAFIDSLPDNARRAVLHARAGMLGGQWDTAQAEAARDQARREGDAPALIAAVTLLGELQLLMSDKAKPYAALRTLAEGLKVAELTHQAADAHLLAVLSYAQQRAGSASKAQRTAVKALERSLPRSPARVWALLVLNRKAEAEAQRLAGQLAAGWFAAFGRE